MNSGTFTKLIIISIILLLLPISQLSAATITTSATCSFENAWASAKANSNTGGCVAVGAYANTANTFDTIELHANAVIAGRDLTLTQPSQGNITVEGGGYTIDANGNDSHFALNNGTTINLNNVKLTNGGGTNQTPGSINLANGGPAATVNITNSVICGNNSTRVNFGGTISVREGQGQGARRLNISNSIICNNTSVGRGGASFSYGGSGNIIGSQTCGFPTVSNNADPRLVQIQPPGPVPTDPNAPHYAYALGAGSPAIDAVDCVTGVTPDLLGRNRPLGARCDIGAVESIPPPPQQPVGNGSGNGSGSGSGNGGGGRGSGDSSRASTEPEPVRISPAQTCAALSPGIMVSNASPGTACQSVSGAAIGHPDLLAAHPASVVDVWGRVTPDTKVCFQASSGSIRFIDTTAMPRTVATLPAFSSDGMICGMIDRAGQVALIADGSNQPRPAARPTPEHGAKPLSDCMVRAKYSLNFRDAPAGAKIGGVPHNAVLTALARTPGWFKVDYHGAKGWIAAMYVEPMGLCG